MDIEDIKAQQSGLGDVSSAFIENEVTVALELRFMDDSR